MTRQSAWLVGAGGHALVCADILSLSTHWQLAGVLDPVQVGSAFLTWQVQSEDQLDEKLALHPHCFLGVGQVKSGLIRERIMSTYRSLGAVFPALVSPRAYVSAYAGLGDGVLVGHGAVIQPLVSLSDGVIVNTGAIVEHGARIGAFSHISTSAVVNGDCAIGEGVMLGSGAVVLQGRHICSGVTVGAGSVVTKDIAEPGVYVGMPARRVESA